MLGANHASEPPPSPRERAIQFVMDHERAIEDGRLPPEPPESLLRQLEPRDRDKLLQLVGEQLRRKAQPAEPRFGQEYRVSGYKILDELGRGGMGVVYKAFEISLGRVVALKMILSGGHVDRDGLSRFRQEAGTIARLNHPNIVEIYRIGEHDGMPYLSLEFLNKGSLDQSLDGVPLPPREAAGIVKTLALAVHYAHEQGIIHRDLKPANVLLGEGGVIKITDFGLAKATGNEGQTLSGTILGTPEYMSPEQAVGRTRDAGPTSDIYSLGVILYELLTGRPPFRETTSLETLKKVVEEEPVSPRQLTRDIPIDMETICLTAMAKEPDRRYPTARAFAGDLELWLEGRPITARPPSVSYRTSKFVRRYRGRLALAALAALTALVGLGASAYRINRESRATREANVLLQDQLYATKIAVAERELTQNHDVGLAGRLLQECPADLRGWEWRYLERLMDGERPPLTGHERGLWMADISPDGKTIATVSIDGSLKLWETASGRLVRSIDADAGALPLLLRPILSLAGVSRIPIMCVEFSPDGRFIATGSFAPKLPFPESPGVITIWDMETGKRVRQFDGQLGVVLSLAYSPDGRRIASSSINPQNTFVVWDANSTEVVKVVSGHKSQIHRLRYSPDGRLIVSGDTEGVVKVWDATTFREVRSILAHNGPVVGAAFEPDGSTFVTGGQDGAVRLWNTATGRLVRDLVGHTGAALGVAFSRDGKLIASAGFDKTVRLWETASGREKITLRGHTDTVWSVAFSPDPESKLLVSASFDKTARVWDTTPLVTRIGPGLFSLVGHTDRVNAVSYSSDGRSLASASSDHDVRVWDAGTGAPLKTLKGHTAAVWGLAISPDGGRVASASWDHTVKVWDPVEGRECLTFSEHTAPVHAVAFSPDGTRLVSGAFDGQTKIWDAATGKLTANCDGFIFPVESVAFSPDGKRVASGGTDRKVKLWDAANGHRLLTLSGHEGSVHGLAFNPDGKRLASAGWDHVVIVWDVDPEHEVTSRSREVLRLTGHKDRVNGVVYSPDGLTIATASEDKTVRLWDARSGKEVVPPSHHRGVVWAVAFSPDGKRLASGTWYKEGWVKTWSIPGAESGIPR